MKSGKIGEEEKKNMINQNYKEVEKKVKFSFINLNQSLRQQK